MRVREVAYGQQGDSRFTTLKELQEQYPSIPDHDLPTNNRKNPSFKGYGGIPISHVKNIYFIDPTTSHTIVIGSSRSAKGETTAVPSIDILSRAEKQSSLVINDPKGELYAAASETLRKRGYKVYLLNLADPSQGMAYNPLQLIVKAWMQGDVETAMQLVNSLTYTLYHEEKAGANSWVYEGAQKAVNGMIIALIEYCIKHNCPEKITLNNIIDMLNELGTVNYSLDPDGFNTTNVLDEFFKHLPQGSIAKREFGSTSFSEAKAKGSIYSTIIQKLSIFSMPKMARMSSENSLDLKTVGFPKYFSFDLDKAYQNKRLKLTFFDKNKEVKAKYTVKVQFGGFVEYNFADELSNNDYVMLKYLDDKNSLSSIYQIKNLNSKKFVTLKELKNDLKVKNVHMTYSDSPTAIFMKVPDYDSSNNALASIFISQLYGELAKQCSYVAGGKTIKRVHFLLDEFGNMQPIKDMDQIMTVSAGRNIIFDLIIQSYKQLFAKYGKDKGQVIKENCQNQILIKSLDTDTNKEFSEQVGNHTIESDNIHKSVMNTAQSINTSSMKVPLITPERLKDMLAGETVVLRPLYRQDLKGRRVRPYAIFNTKKTIMPFAHTFLADEFDTRKSPDLLEIDAPHANLDLRSLSINWRNWITFDDRALAAFDERQKANLKNEEEHDETKSNRDEGSHFFTPQSNQNSKTDIYLKFAEKYKDEIPYEEFCTEAMQGADENQLQTLLSGNMMNEFFKYLQNSKAE